MQEKTYAVANVCVKSVGEDTWLEVYLMLLDNSKHRQLQVGAFSVEGAEVNKRYSIEGSSGVTSIWTFVGGSPKYRYTRFSFKLEKNVVKLLEDEALLRFAVQDLSQKERVRHVEEICFRNGRAQGINASIWLKDE